VIFCGAQISPSAGIQVRICPNTEIRTMDMGMGSIRVDVITRVEEQPNPSLMLCEIVDIYCTGNCLHFPRAQCNLVGKP
jgi:hypothetical protein